MALHGFQSWLRSARCMCIMELDAWRAFQGPYVLVLLNTGHAHRSNRLPAGWLLTTYRSLSRPFRKHVKRIVLARPPQTRRRGLFSRQKVG